MKRCIFQEVTHFPHHPSHTKAEPTHGEGMARHDMSGELRHVAGQRTRSQEHDALSGRIRVPSAEQVEESARHASARGADERGRVDGDQGLSAFS